MRDFVSSGLETQGSNTTWDDADAEEAMELHTAAELDSDGRVSDFDLLARPYVRGNWHSYDDNDTDGVAINDPQRSREWARGVGRVDGPL